MQYFRSIQKLLSFPSEIHLQENVTSTDAKKLKLYNIFHSKRMQPNKRTNSRPFNFCRKRQ